MRITYQKNSSILMLSVLLFILASILSSCLGSKSSPREYPFSDQSLVDILSARQDTSIMARALKDSGLDAALQDAKGYSILIPTDNAVKQLLPELQQALSEDPQVLSQVLREIMINGVYSREELAAATDLQTLSGVPVKLTGRGSNQLLNGSQLVQADLFGREFVVHVVAGITLMNIRLR